MKGKIMKKAALYVRVSTSEQAMHGYSLAAQEELLRRFADDHGMTVHEVYADEGKSASKSLDKRTELLRLIADAEKGKFKIVLFKDLTRWTRNAAAYYKVEERLEKAGVAWIAVEQPYLETVTPTGRFQVQVMIGTAQLEAEQTGQRIKFVQDAEVRRGRYPFPPHAAPVGYTTEKREDGNFLVIDPATAPIVKTVFEAFKRSYNLQRCVEAVRERHGIEYAHTQINRILRNPIYKGEFRGIVDFVEPIIPPDEWDALQRPKRVFTAQKHRGEYIFSGMVKCAVCGATLRASCPDDRYYLYTCKNAHGVCIEQGKLEKKILSMIAPELDRYKVIVKQRKKDNRAVTAERRKLTEKNRRLTELYMDGIVDRTEYDRRRKEIEERLADLEPAPDLPEVTTDFSEMYSKLTLEKKAVFWRAFLDHITIDREKTISIAFHTAKVLAERMAMLE